MFQSIKEGFGVTIGVVIGLALIGALTNGLKIDISKLKKETPSAE